MTATASAAMRWCSESRAGWVESAVCWHGVIVGEQTGRRSGNWAGRLLCADCSKVLLAGTVRSQPRQGAGGTTLTPAGHTFLVYARRILQLMEESRNVLMDRRGHAT